MRRLEIVNDANDLVRFGRDATHLHRERECVCVCVCACVCVMHITTITHTHTRTRLRTRSPTRPRTGSHSTLALPLTPMLSGCKGARMWEPRKRLLCTQ